MNPTLRILLTDWSLRVEITLPLVLAALFYITGWRRLRARGSQRLATGWRLAAFLAGLLALAVALMSAVDALGAMLFFMHMIQHLLLIMVAAPLIILGNPFPFIIWGMPYGRTIGQALFRSRAPFRRVLSRLTSPGVVWMVFVAVLIGWHDPGAYNAALRSELVHDLEHLSDYGAALLFWWHILQAGPRIHRPLSPGARIAYTLSVVPANMVTGIVISFAGSPIYEYYTTVPRVWGLNALQDQQLGGTLMWIPGSMMYLLAGIILIGRLLQGEESPRPRNHMAAVVVVLAVVSLLGTTLPVVAHGGGAPQLTNEPVGPYRIFVWSKPDPLRVGQAHFTVGVFALSENDQADIPVMDAEITMTLSELSATEAHEEPLVRTVNKASELYYYELDMEIPRSGDWRASISVQGADGGGSATFDMAALPPDTNWTLIGGALVALVAVGWWMWSLRSGNQNR